MSHMTFFIIVFGVVFFIAFGLLFLMLGRVMWEDYRDYRAKRNKEKGARLQIPFRHRSK